MNRHKQPADLSRVSEDWDRILDCIESPQWIQSLTWEEVILLNEAIERAQPEIDEQIERRHKEWVRQFQIDK